MEVELFVNDNEEVMLLEFDYNKFLENPRRFIIDLTKLRIEKLHETLKINISNNFGEKYITDKLFEIHSSYIEGDYDLCKCDRCSLSVLNFYKNYIALYFDVEITDKGIFEEQTYVDDFMNMKYILPHMQQRQWLFLPFADKDECVQKLYNYLDNVCNSINKSMIDKVKQQYLNNRATFK